jgi:pimeloyl-ACP methyl ester carboxylesterase
MEPMSDPMCVVDPPSSFTVRSTNGVDLRVHDFGGSGTPVLAAHATGFNGLAWTPLARALGGCHVLAPDFRAHGGSPVSRGADLAWDRFADDVLAVIDDARWEMSGDGVGPVGIGHSMGGAALLLAELRRPGTFSGLWVFEPIIFPPDMRAVAGSADNPLSAGARRRRPSFPSRADARSTYGSKPPMNRFADEALAGYVEAGFADEPDGTVRLACHPEDEARIYTTATTCTAFEHLGEISCPVAVVRGVVETLSPARIAGPATEALARGHLVAHDELSHFGPMEDPIGLAAEIGAFISTLRA